MNASQATVPAAAKLTTAAMMAKALSKPLIAETGAGAWRGAGAAGGDIAERCAVGGAATRAPEPPVGGAGGFGPVAGAATGAAAEVVLGGGAPVGNVGNLIVGEAVGFGGKLMRTVSFLGWTLAASAGLGGTAPEGKLRLSAIIFCTVQARVGENSCQILIPLRQKKEPVKNRLRENIF